MKFFFETLIFRRATKNDLLAILALLAEDELGKTRESLDQAAMLLYEAAFQKIENDPNHALMVIELEGEIIGTCHLTLIPSLSFRGASRMQVESVHIARVFRGRGIGTWMFQQIFEYAQQQQARIVQLTTNKKRMRAKKFYEALGFQATHEGMKMYL